MFNNWKQSNCLLIIPIFIKFIIPFRAMVYSLMIALFAQGFILYYLPKIIWGLERLPKCSFPLALKSLLLDLCVRSIPIVLRIVGKFYVDFFKSWKFDTLLETDFPVRSLDYDVLGRRLICSIIIINSYKYLRNYYFVTLDILLAYSKEKVLIYDIFPKALRYINQFFIIIIYD